MMEKSNLTMLTDFYEITMANGYCLYRYGRQYRLL